VVGRGVHHAIPARLIRRGLTSRLYSATGGFRSLARRPCDAAADSSSPISLVHPCARGEHQPRIRRASRHRGSSPRTRGTRSRPRRTRGMRRFIPAHAGNTVASRSSGSRPSGSSPRTRGTRGSSLEHLHRQLVHPRARGEHPMLPVMVHVHDRFIPAHAGNTSEGVIRSIYDGGSSPRTRGTRQRGLEHGDRQRFIPAHAGNTRKTWPRPWATTVHPRARGEHPGAHLGRQGIDRFIPAHAGNTTALLPVVSRPDGSSPRTRGTRGQGLGRRLPGRFIPAHAGNTVADGALCRRWRLGG
jgi:hypothetical protein